MAALLITEDGHKVPVGLYIGDTENSTVVTALLADLRSRGLNGEMLFIIDGSKALARGIKKVFGEDSAIQRCTLHKRRNLVGHLPKEIAKTMDERLRRAFNHENPKRGKDLAKALAKELEADHPDAAGSILEGLDEMFTIRELGLTGPILKSLTTTNPIESMISTIRRTTDRVTNWKDARMKRYWVASGIFEAERRFNRIQGYRDLPKLRSALQARRQTIAGSEGYAEGVA